ncbi:MAG: CopD family protein [Rubrivivax sp.]|nr:CopD family protein [Rubrivivax sp.]
MFYAILKTVHLLSIIVWIGGMTFVHFFLRPAVAALEAPERVRLTHVALGRFFNAVLVAGVLAIGSGLWMMGRIAKQTVQAGAQLSLPPEWMAMAVLGVVMLAIFGHTRFALYPRLTRAVTAASWPAGDAALASIRTWLMVNLVVGVVIVAVTLLGLGAAGL